MGPPAPLRESHLNSWKNGQHAFEGMFIPSEDEAFAPETLHHGSLLTHDGQCPSSELGQPDQGPSPPSVAAMYPLGSDVSGCLFLGDDLRSLLAASWKASFSWVRMP